MLKMNRVTFGYDKKNTILNNMSANFGAGKMYVIMGKSGAGKSTLLSLLSGLDVCSDGEIRYQGQNLAHINRNNYRAKNIGIVFQSYNLLTNATAVDNVTLSMEISGKKITGTRKKAYALLQSVGIDRQTADRTVLRLSGGEQQRIAIAGAIAHEPDIVIADEPTGNLDNETEQEIMNILLQLAHEQGKCVIIVTHSRDAAKYAAELWGLTKGNLNFIKR